MSFTCPKCGMTSQHPEDEAQGYCGFCHNFTGITPTTYMVVIDDGPAEGWSYITFVVPEQIILVAPNPAGHGEWMRVPVEAAWDMALTYQREPIDSYTAQTSDGDLVLSYRLA